MTGAQSWLPANIAGLPDGSVVQVFGVLSDVVIEDTPQSGLYAQAVLSTGDGSIHIRVYPQVFGARGGMLLEGSRVTATGRLDRRGTVPFVTAREVMR